MILPENGFLSHSRRGKMFKRAILAIVLAIFLAGTSTSSTNAAPQCHYSFRPVVSLKGGQPGDQVVVRANGKEVGTITFDAQGKGELVFGEPGVEYNVEVIWRGQVLPNVGGKVNCPVPTLSESDKRELGMRSDEILPRESSTRTSGDIVGTSAILGDPINAATGEYYFNIELLNLGGIIPLSFRLYYGSQIDSKRFPDGLPYRFYHNNRQTLMVNKDFEPPVVFIETGMGAEIGFHKTASGWEAYDLEGIRYQLKETPAYFYLLDPISNLVSAFKKFPQPGATDWGFLEFVQDRNGNRLTYELPSDANQARRQGPLRVYDGLGRELRFIYSQVSPGYSLPQLVRVEDQNNRAIVFIQEYDPPDNHELPTLRSIVDPLGNATVFTYDEYDRIVSVKRPLGNIPFTQSYNPNNQFSGIVLSQTDAFSNTTKINAQNFRTSIEPVYFKGNVVSVRVASRESRFDVLYADGSTQGFAHERTSRVLKEMTDSTGKKTSFESDPKHERITSVTDRMGDTTKITYHAETGQIASITNARGETIAFTYAPQTQTLFPSGESIPFTFFNLTRIDYPDRTSEQFTFDAKGNLVAAIDRAGQSWKFTYNERGQLLTATNPNGGVTTLTYNADGTLASQKDSDTGAITYGYDAFKRPTKMTNADGSTVQIAYDPNDRVTAFTDENNHTTKFAYDANGNLMQLTDGAGQSFTYSYDLMDRVTKITDRLGKVSAFAHDKLGRLAAHTDSTGVETQYGYDPRGWLDQITRGGEAWKIGYDDEGVEISRTTPSGNTAKFARDKLGALVGATDPLGQTSTAARDAANRITSITDALNRVTAYGYDPRDLISAVTMPIIGSAKYERDASGRITRITDLNGQEWQFTRTPMGRLQSQTDPLGKATQYAYDPRGRLMQTTFPDSVTANFTYDAAGNLTRSRYSDGTDLQFAYDALNRLVSANGIKFARDAEGRITNTTNAPHNDILDSTATYDDAGRLKTVSLGALVVTYSYDPKTGLLTNVSDALTNTQIDFSYDRDLQLTGIARSNKVNTTLTWDKAGRLMRIQEGNVLDLQYTLDAAGQVSGVKMTAPLNPASVLKASTQTNAFNAGSQITSPGYAYDARGRRTVSPNGKLVWDGASRLIGIGETKLEYNGLGDVIARTEGGKTTRYAYNYALGLAPIIAELDDAGKPLRYYVWTPTGVLLYMVDAADGNKVYFYHFDRTGSTLALTDVNGKVTDAYAYDPFGKLLAHQGKNPQPFTFAGQWGARQECFPSASACGTLYQMRARYYDASTMQFLSREPIWPNIADPRQLNPYQYALNNPLRYVDLTGTDPSDLSTFLRDSGFAFSFDDVPRFASFDVLLNWAKAQAPPPPRFSSNEKPGPRWTEAEQEQFKRELAALNVWLGGENLITFEIRTDYGWLRPYFKSDIKKWIKWESKRETNIKLRFFVQKWSRIFWGRRDFDEQALRRMVLIEWWMLFAPVEERQKFIQQDILSHDASVWGWSPR
jgi:RHS repeat-associated protein